VADRLDRLEDILTRFITASLSNANIELEGPMETTGGRRSTVPQESQEYSESYIQVEFTTLPGPDDSKKRIYHKKGGLSSRTQHSEKHNPKPDQVEKTFLRKHDSF
jgi:hypothetical protein